MKPKTITAFCQEASHIPASLIRATVRQCGGWADFQEMAEDVANHGADGGFSGFIYYAETEAFFKRNKESILQLAQEMASDMGQPFLDFIAGFNCLGCEADDVAEAIYGTKKPDDSHVKNALAWFAFEEVARAFSDM